MNVCGRATRFGSSLTRLREASLPVSPHLASSETLPTAGVKHLVNVRRFPGSRRYPQFGEELLAASSEEGIGYSHLPGRHYRGTRTRSSPRLRLS